MFPSLPRPGKKREREDTDDYSPSGFSEHRSKRHVTTLPHRTSPSSRRPPPAFGGVQANTTYTAAIFPLPPTITPVDSDCDSPPDAAASGGTQNNKCVFSPWGSSSPTQTPRHSQPENSSPTFLLSSQMSDAPAYTDDMDHDMMDYTSSQPDSQHLSPGFFHVDSSSSIASRIPTPIHSSFAPYSRPEKSLPLKPDPFASFHSRRLPSPISEDEISPSAIVSGFNSMAMSMETESPCQGHTPKQSSPLDKSQEKDTPMKKGHQRNKHSLRNYTGFDVEQGAKRTFSMGYRADCEKCRNKVPGHFSHIVTY